MVRLLGPVDVIGVDGTPWDGRRRDAVELLAWLVTHRAWATRADAQGAL
jgi:hypothetical protein